MKPTYLNLNYPKVYTSSKTSGQIEITSKVLDLLNIFKTKYNYIYQIQQGKMQIIVVHFSVYKHHFKLKTEVIIG